MGMRSAWILPLVLLLAPARADAKSFKQCLPKDVDSTPSSMPDAPGAELYACYSHYHRPTCVRVNPDTGATTFEAFPNPPPRKAPIDLRAKPGGARLCKLDASRHATKDCRLIAVQRAGFEPDPDEDPAEAEEWGSGDDIDADIDETGTLLLMSWVDDDGYHVETWALGDKDSRIARFELARKDDCAASVELVGKSLLIDETCKGKSKSWLATPKGKKIAALGGSKPMVVGGSPVRLGGELWAFIGNDGRVIVQDVKTGKVKLKTARVELAEPGYASLAALADGRVGVFYGKAHAGEVVIVDPAKGTAAPVWTIARCER